MGIKIITDSACDMTVEEAKDMGIVLMPLTVTFGEESYKESGIDFSKPCALTYAGLSRSLLDKYIQDSKELYKDYDGELTISSVGCAIGTHIGPGAIGAAFFV